MLETQKLQTQTVQFWEKLVHTLHFLDVKILECLYLPEPTTTYFRSLMNQIGRWNVKRTAIRNRVTKLEKLGLLETINSGLLVINSIPQIADNIQKMILHCKIRWQE